MATVFHVSDSQQNFIITYDEDHKQEKFNLCNVNFQVDSDNMFM